MATTSRINKNQERPPWLDKAFTINPIIHINKKKLTWLNGLWIDGSWQGQFWENGVFLNGSVSNTSWRGGIFNRGYITNSTVSNTIIHNAIIKNCSFKNCIIHRCVYDKIELDKSCKILNGISVNFYENDWNVISKSIIPTPKNLWPKWLQLCDTENAIITIDAHNIPTWYGGVFKNGIWRNGIWLNGEFKNGTWLDGIWENGIWRYGTWKDGLWKYGLWCDGIFMNGVFEDGDIIGGCFVNCTKRVNNNYVKNHINTKTHSDYKWIISDMLVKIGKL